MWDDRGSVHNLKTGKVGQARPVERGKEGGGVFPGPATIGARQRSKILKRVFRWLLSDLKYAYKIHFRPARTPLES